MRFVKYPTNFQSIHEHHGTTKPITLSSLRSSTHSFQSKEKWAKGSSYPCNLNSLKNAILGNYCSEHSKRNYSGLEDRAHKKSLCSKPTLRCHSKFSASKKMIEQSKLRNLDAHDKHNCTISLRFKDLTPWRLTFPSTIFSYFWEVPNTTFFQPKFQKLLLPFAITKTCTNLIASANEILP